MPVCSCLSLNVGNAAVPCICITQSNTESDKPTCASNQSYE